LRHLRYSSKPFANLKSSSSVGAAAAVCRALGAHAYLPSLVEQLLRLAVCDCSAAIVLRAEALWCLNEALLGAALCRHRHSTRDGTLRVQRYHAVDEDTDTAAYSGLAGKAADRHAGQSTEADHIANDGTNFNPRFEAFGDKTSLPWMRCDGSDERELSESVMMLLQELLSHDVWDASRGHAKVTELHLEVVERELLLQIIGSAIYLLSQINSCNRTSDLQVALRFALFPTLERLGDSNALLSRAAEITLCRFCMYTDTPMDSVPQLLAANFDFILETMCARLRHSPWYPQIAQVMQALLEFGGAETIPLIGNAIDELFLLIDDAVADGATAAMMLPRLHALHSIVLAGGEILSNEIVVETSASPHAATDHGVKQQVSASDDKVHSDGTRTPPMAFSGDLSSFVNGLIANFVLQYRGHDWMGRERGAALQMRSNIGATREGDGFRQLTGSCALSAEHTKQRLGNGEVMQPAQKGGANMVDVEEENIVALPAAGQLVLRTMEKIEVLLLAGTPSVTHLLLGILNGAIPALARWPRVLLGALHPIWPPLFVLMNESNLSVAKQALSLLEMCAERLGEHLPSMVLQDALKTILRAFLRWHGVLHGWSEVPSTSQETPSRLQDFLFVSMRCLKALCKWPRQTRNQAWNVLGAVKPLLSQESKSIQAAAMGIAYYLVSLNRDAVWLVFVRDLHEVQRPLPPPSTQVRQLGKSQAAIAELKICNTYSASFLAFLSAQDARILRDSA